MDENNYSVWQNSYFWSFFFKKEINKKNKDKKIKTMKNVYNRTICQHATIHHDHLS